MTDRDWIEYGAKGLMIGVGAPLFYLLVTAPLGQKLTKWVTSLAAKSGRPLLAHRLQKLLTKKLW